MKISKCKRTRLILSIIALAEVLVLAAGITFSWMEGGNRGSVNGSEIVISSGSNLTMIQDGNNVNTITVPVCTLEEVSSSDGRNYYFPLSDNTSSNTAEMTFREGTASDENAKYLSLDFQFIAGSTVTKVYLGAGTIIRCTNENVMKALRMSFSLNDGSNPVVFKPNQMPGVVMQYSPITAITDDGVATTTQTSTRSYGDFYFKGTGESEPLFTLAKNETKNITLSIWLEGTEFDSDDVAEQNLGIYIDFTTQADDLVKYNFVDNCHNSTDNPIQNFWVDDNADNGQYPTMMYIFDTESSRYYAMEKSSDYDNDRTWSVYVPRSITNFYFRRYSIDIDRWWNEWEPSMTDIKTDPNGEHTFVAICGNGQGEGEELAGCYGYWKDQYGTYRIYFQNSVKWTDLHCYAWKSDGSFASSTGAWPGSYMDPVENHDNLYYIDLKETDNITGIQFNSGKVTTTIYFEYNYGDSTYAYVYSADESKKYSGDWPGQKADYDAATGYYRYTFTTTDTGYFKVIVNNNNQGQQFPASGQSGYQGTLGKSYLFKNGSFEEYNVNYELTDTQFFFNGFACWYENPNKSGKWLYTDKENSLIYPNI